jgi:PLP dependent protein
MIKENLHDVQNKIKASLAKRTSAAKEEKITLIAVTKNHDVAAMREAIDEGVFCIGENRIQEAVGKAETLERKVQWHLIGHLQTNKAKQAVKLFDLIHSIDSEKLADQIDKEAQKIGKVQDVLLQVNLAREESKFGFSIEEMPAVLAKIDQWDNLHVCGLMCIAPNYEEVEQTRPLFRGMYGFYQGVKKMQFKTAEMKYLSMGMSHDYTIAIEEGANIVRVGTAIFGQRQY